MFNKYLQLIQLAMTTSLQADGQFIVAIKNEKKLKPQMGFCLKFLTISDIC